MREAMYIMPSLLFPVYRRFWSIKKTQKKLQILLGGTKVFDYVLICLKELKR